MTLTAKQLDERIELNALIAARLVRYGYTKKELAIKLSMSPASLYNKLNNPDRFTRKELRKLFEVFNFTQQEKLNIV